MNVLIVGCGRVGSGLAADLIASGHEVTVVDRSPVAFRGLPPDFPGTIVHGSGLDRDDLVAAGIEDADAFAAVTSGDNTNIVSARIARESYGIANVVARIFDPRRAAIYERLGIPTVASVAWATAKIAQRLDPQAQMPEWQDATGEVVLIERALPDGWAGRNLDGLHTAGSTLTAVRRGGATLLAEASMVGQPGDVLYLTAYRRQLATLDELLAITHETKGHG